MISYPLTSSSVQSAIPESAFDENGVRTGVLPLRKAKSNKNAVSDFNVFFMSVSS